MRVPFDRTESICIVGVGAVTSVGMSAPSSAAAVRAGITGFADHPHIIDRTSEPVVVASVPHIDADVIGVDRFIALVLPAAREALEPVSQLLRGAVPIRSIIGLPELRPGLPAELAPTLAAKLPHASTDVCRIGPSTMLSNGHCSGLMAIESTCRMIHSGETEFCLVGGVDSYMEPDTLGWVESCEQLHTPHNAWGFIPGEAAGFCLLCSDTAAARYKLNVLGRLLAVSTYREKNRIKTETVCLGQGLSAAVGEVLQVLPPDEKIHDTICDQNGETYRADEFGFMLVRHAEHFVDGSGFQAPADCWGDVGAASGPLFVVLATAAAQRKYAKGPLTLLWTSSEGGERTAAILHTDI